MRRRAAVIGTGIIGACVGWSLERYGADVVFIDPVPPGEGVTNWSFSWVNASAKTANRPYFELNVAAMTAYRELTATIGSGSWWHPSGHLRWADDPTDLLATAELLNARGYRAELWTGAAVRRELEPALVLPDAAPVVYYPDEAWVHGRRLATHLAGEAVALGADHRSGTAVRDIGLRNDGSVRAVELSDGNRLDVDLVVNAAGPRAAQVARLVGRQLPMRREPGAVARLACERVPIYRAMHTPHIEIRPDTDTSVVLHSREIDALVDTDVEPGQLLQALAKQVLPELGDARITETRVVERPIPADGLPSVGAVRTIPGYYEAVSHSGITLGPLIGQLLAAEIMTGDRSKLLTNFHPERLTAPPRT